MESFSILYYINPDSPKYEMLLSIWYVWDKLRPSKSNGYFEQNMAKKAKSIF